MHSRCRTRGGPAARGPAPIRAGHADRRGAVTALPPIAGPPTTPAGAGRPTLADRDAILDPDDVTLASFLAEAGRILGSSLDSARDPPPGRRADRPGRRRLVRDRPAATPTARCRRSRSPIATPIARRARGRAAPPLSRPIPTAPVGAYAVARSGRPMLIPEIDDAVIAAVRARRGSPGAAPELELAVVDVRADDRPAAGSSGPSPSPARRAAGRSGQRHLRVRRRPRGSGRRRHRERARLPGGGSVPADPRRGGGGDLRPRPGERRRPGRQPRRERAARAGGRATSSGAALSDLVEDPVTPTAIDRVIRAVRDGRTEARTVSLRFRRDASAVRSRPRSSSSGSSCPARHRRSSRSPATSASASRSRAASSGWPRPSTRGPPSSTPSSGRWATASSCAAPTGGRSSPTRPAGDVPGRVADDATPGSSPSCATRSGAAPRSGRTPDRSCCRTRADPERWIELATYPVADGTADGEPAARRSSSCAT